MPIGSYIRTALMVLAFAAASAQLVCASADLADPNAGHDHFVHHGDDDREHEDGSAGFSACVTHHGAVAPAMVSLAVRSSASQWDRSASAVFATLRRAPPLSPPKDFSA